MAEVAYRDVFNHTDNMGTFDIIRGFDKNVREFSNELYMFRRETQHELSEIKKETSGLTTSNIDHDKRIDRLQDDVSELKQEVKELHKDVSDIKGDIKAIAAGFGAAQNRFNWGLVILGIIVALIQLLK